MTEIPRDQYGRPKITQAEGMPQAYTRVSTLAKSLDNSAGLATWKQRMVANGLALRPDLVLGVLAAAGNTQTVDSLCQQALEAAGSSSAANYGTALHSLTELMDGGHELPAGLGAKELGDLNAYRKRMEDVRVVEMETFVVNDEIQAAGSLDRLIEWKGELVVADIKTGQHEPRYPHSVSLQTAIYARSTPYTHEEGRKPRAREVSTTTGLLIHLPAGQAKCDIYELDIQAGWEAVQLALNVRQWLKAKPAVHQP